jgi:hypothetical protein
VEILLKKRTYWQHGLLDDVAIGRLLSDHLADFEIKSVNIQSLEQVEKLTNKEIGSSLHFRCKSSKIKRDDVEIMKQLISKMNL